MMKVCVRSDRGVVFLSLAALFFLYAIVALHAYSTTGPEVRPAQGSDNIAYVRMASLPVFQREFLAGERAFVYALLLKATGKNLTLAGHAQTLLALCCWGFLAWASLRLFATKRGKILGFGLVLLCSLREEVLFWNGISLSESLSLSIFAMWIGSWIMLARGSHKFWKLLPVVTSFLFAFVRDSNAFLVLGAAILLAIASARRPVASLNLLLSLVLLGFFAGSVASRSYSLRSQYSLQNIIGGRALADDWRHAEFRKAGMPGRLSPSERTYLAGRCGDAFAGRANALVGIGSPGTEDIIRWSTTTGQGDYLRFLAGNPSYLLFRPFQEDGVLKFVFPLAGWAVHEGCSPALRHALPPGFGTLLPQPLRLVLQGEPPAWLLGFWAVTVLGCTVAFARCPPVRGPLLWTAVLLLASIPHLLVIWHGDALDVPRHALLVGIQVHLALAFAFALACDALSATRQAR